MTFKIIFLCHFWKLTPNRIVAMSLKDSVCQAFGWCCTASKVKTADCAAPMKFAHVANDSCAGYLFNVNPCKVLHDLICVCLLRKLLDCFFQPLSCTDKLFFIVVIAYCYHVLVAGINLLIFFWCMNDLCEFRQLAGIFICMMSQADLALAVYILFISSCGHVSTLINLSSN